MPSVQPNETSFHGRQHELGLMEIAGDFHIMDYTLPCCLFWRNLTFAHALAAAEGIVAMVLSWANIVFSESGWMFSIIVQSSDSHI